jgi:histidyl-tRNA synthetase
MRDLLPEEMIRRRHVVDRVREVFEAFGFGPLETPALEREETLLGKYGAEAERLMYSARHAEGKDRLALRYDLSVPLARVVAAHQDLPKPFKRYQIAPVWRAERPQKGRYREFYQCDVDTVGAPGMLADAEIVQVVYEVLTRLGFSEFTIRLNNRKILNGIGQIAGVPADLLPGLYRSIDKLERIGLEGVQQELESNRIAGDAVGRLMTLLQVSGESHQVLGQLRDHLGRSVEAGEGIGELEEILSLLDAMGVARDRVRVDFAMVRGLEYYTGPIYETVVERPRIGSLTGGGRYDRLICLFTGRDLPATGTSLGIERIIDVMEERNMLPAGVRRTVTQALVTVFDAALLPASLGLAGRLRQAGVNTEVFLERRPLSDQIRYADRTGIPVAIFLGPEEDRAGQVTLRHLRTGQERAVPAEQAAAAVRAWVEEV